MPEITVTVEVEHWDRKDKIEITTWRPSDTPADPGVRQAADEAVVRTLAAVDAWSRA